MSDLRFPNYQIKKDARGEYYWVYYARNGEAIAKSTEGYVKKASCAHSIDIMKGTTDHRVYDLDGELRPA